MNNLLKKFILHLDHVAESATRDEIMKLARVLEELEKDRQLPKALPSEQTDSKHPDRLHVA